jgi:hypothetical protein
MSENKDRRHASPVDHTPGMTLRKTAAMIALGYVVALVMNPGAPGRWAYMLTDGPVAWAVQDAVKPASDQLGQMWQHSGLQVPFDGIKNAGRALRGKTTASLE